MTTEQATKLKLYLDKTAGLSLASLETAPLEATPTPSATDSSTDIGKSVVNTLGSGVTNAGLSTVTPFTRPSSWAGVASNLKPTLGGLGMAAGEIGKGALGGLAYGAMANGLPIVENGIERAVGYKPTNNAGSNLYSGIQDPKSLYLSQDPNQQSGSPTRTWSNWLDQSMTGTGGIKNLTNSTLAGRAFGAPGMIFGAASNALSNLYSDAKGLYNWHNIFNQGNEQQKNISDDMGRTADRQTYQASHNIPLHVPTPEEAATYNQPALAKQSGYTPHVKPLSEKSRLEISNIVDLGQYYQSASKHKKKLNKSSSESSYPTFNELRIKYSDKEHNHHLKLKCVKCGNTETCRCSAKKELHLGVCSDCENIKTAEFEDLKSRIYSLLHKYFKIKPPISKVPISYSTPVSSSNISSVGYNPSTSEMQVDFKNHSKYKYPFIAKHTYDDFMSASSKGKYFHKNIKPIGLYEKVSKVLN